MTLRRLTAEFIGTFSLILIICMTTYAKVSADLQPLAIGLFLMGTIYTHGYMSGAVFNPAVTLALWLRGRLTPKESLAYIGVQMLAAVAAAAFTIALTIAKPIVQPIAPPPQYFAFIPTILAETMGTFLLCWVILNVATSKTIEGNNFYGLAIGTTVTGLIYTFGSVSNGVFNPAVALALCITQINNWGNLGLYVVSAFVGAALAALAYRFVNREE
jgi:aquaporin Z